MALPALSATLAALSLVALATGAGAAAREGPADGPAAAVTPRPAAAAPQRAPWSWPVEPATVLRRFAVGPHPWSPGHRGVDLAAAPGTPVRAPAAGIVTWAGRVAARGVVVVAHTDPVAGTAVRTTYEPVDAAVPVGTALAARAVLGTVAASGSTEGAGHCGAVACLHWGALAGREYLDPLAFVTRRAPPVLLPLR